MYITSQLYYFFFVALFILISQSLLKTFECKCFFTNRIIFVYFGGVQAKVFEIVFLLLIFTALPAFSWKFGLIAILFLVFCGNFYHTLSFILTAFYFCCFRKLMIKTLLPIANYVIWNSQKRTKWAIILFQSLINR